MNYIGHILLTYPHERITLGNLIGDMVRNAHLDLLPGSVADGVMVHRAIDHFTDRHPEVRKAVALLRDRHGKYAPVVLDILIDHLICREWERYADISFDRFTEWVYNLIAEHADELPANVGRRITSMAAHRWLHQYTHIAGLEAVLVRMDSRARFPSYFAEATDDLELFYPLLKGGMARFYPEARAHVENIIREM